MRTGSCGGGGAGRPTVLAQRPRPSLPPFATQPRGHSCVSGTTTFLTPGEPYVSSILSPRRTRCSIAETSLRLRPPPRVGWRNWCATKANQAGRFSCEAEGGRVSSGLPGERARRGEGTDEGLGGDELEGALVAVVDLALQAGNPAHWHPACLAARGSG